MSKTMLTEVDGFTPVIDDLIKDTSLMTAIVFGVIWRHCQMSDGYCHASKDKLSKILGVSRQTIVTHAELLVDKKYLNKYETKGEPTKYYDTGKAGVSSRLTGGVKQIDRGCQADLQGGVKQIDTSKTIKDTIKIAKDTLPIPEEHQELVGDIMPSPIPTNGSGATSKPKGRTKKPADPRANHPALLKYKDLVEYCVPIAARDMVISAVGESPGDIERWGAVITEWIGRGYKPTNTGGMVGVYRDGWQNKNSRSDNRPELDTDHIIFCGQNNDKS